MTLWEYDIKSIRAHEWVQMKKDLNEIGFEGWELIKLSDDMNENGITKAVFKRPLDYVDAL
ncbi:hypothetical protein [Methanosalsum natronophilum]|uniref:DUF4177 domain-containing protein n=1 Tax=Methanosalsum natronophilum TaxID=768733 RepID=A0A3R7XW05_9EURY|nr:hypothetical protein [Methanosalsum natronophilum]MCS3924165.1 hypothetical protein [Methanosalsum natronophilum]RQD92466.1 MAG: hypothetical protein D5R95_00390 [Methanosalsum natronophilum]